MRLKALRSGGWRNLSHYLYFERIALLLVLLMLSAIAAYAIVFAAVKVANDMLLGEAFLEKAALQDTFGLLLTIVIVLEFNHSIFIALTERTGAIQARIMVIITILVVARKLMLMDFTALDAQMLLAFGGLLLALGGLYWLISNVIGPTSSH
jgi:Phosphate-starvation-inducible E family